MTRYMPLVALVAAIGCAPTVDVEQEQTALLAADRAWSQTVKDPDAFATYLATDATFYPPGMPAVTGTDAIRKTFGEMSSAPGFSLSWTADEAVVAASGDIGYTSGKYTSSMAGATEQGKYVTVWKKEGDAWKVTEDIFNADSTPQAASSHVMMSPGELKWTEAPPSLPPGARIAVVSGDPTQAGAFVLRAQVPAGYKVPPHWHPGVENLTVISGTIALGMGEQWDEAKMTTVATGGYASLPAEMRHSFLAKSAATFQVDGMGPFAVNYVNPADDPSKQQK
jgi:ketosteroid isomerase-like protein